MLRRDRASSRSLSTRRRWRCRGLGERIVRFRGGRSGRARARPGSHRDRRRRSRRAGSGMVGVTVNGEGYGCRGLRRGLEARGYLFRSQSDTEVLLHLYADKGEAMEHELRGMFTFALWDSRKRALLLARDPYGIKP